MLDLLPSLRGLTVTRTFDPQTWGAPLRAVGADIRFGDISLRDAVYRRKVAFYLDVDGSPVCQSLCPVDVWFPTLVTRVTSTLITVGRAILYVDAALPLHTSIADVAFPGNSLAGARMADITVVDASGHRRTVHAELPANVVVTGAIALALAPVSSTTGRVDDDQCPATISASSTVTGVRAPGRNHPRRGF